MGVVFVAQRQVQDEILLARDADPRELVLDRVAGFRRRRLLRYHAGAYWPLLSSKGARPPGHALSATGCSTSTPSISTRAAFGNAAT